MALTDDQKAMLKLLAQREEGYEEMAALMGIAPIWVFTHDSVGLGEDGPTHQPIEHLEALRAIPHLTLIRPADANETAVAWKAALTHRGGPVLLALTRQKLPTWDRSVMESADGVLHGGYILCRASGAPRLVLLGTGSEVAICMAARDILEQEGIHTQVVSMPSVDMYLAQPGRYRDQVLPPAVTSRVAVEQASTFGWAHYVGPTGAVVGMTSFGASAPLKELQKEFGFTLERVVETARKQLKRTR